MYIYTLTADCDLNGDTPMVWFSINMLSVILATHFILYFTLSVNSQGLIVFTVGVNTNKGSYVKLTSSNYSALVANIYIHKYLPPSGNFLMLNNPAHRKAIQ